MAIRCTTLHCPMLVPWRCNKDARTRSTYRAKGQEPDCRALRGPTRRSTVLARLIHGKGKECLDGTVQRQQKENERK